MQLDPNVVGLVIAGIVISIALFRFRHVIARLTIGKNNFTLNAKNDESTLKNKTQIEVGNVERSSLDVVAGSRGSDKSNPVSSETNIHVGDVKGSDVTITGKTKKREEPS